MSEINIGEVIKYLYTPTDIKSVGLYGEMINDTNLSMIINNENDKNSKKQLLLLKELCNKPYKSKLTIYSINAIILNNKILFEHFYKTPFVRTPYLLNDGFKISPVCKYIENNIISGTVMKDNKQREFAPDIYSNIFIIRGTVTEDKFYESIKDTELLKFNIILLYEQLEDEYCYGVYD